MKLIQLLKNKKLTKEMIDNASAEELNYIDDEKDPDSCLLFLAIYKGKIDIIEALIKNEKCDLNIIAQLGVSILNVAICKDDIRTVKLLINNPRFKLINLKPHMPIINAFNRANLEIIKLILSDKNLDINVFNEEGYSPILLSVRLGYKKYEIFKIILENESLKTINNTENKLGCNVLHWSVKNNYLISVKLLLKHKQTNINCLTILHDNISSLHIAIQEENIIMIKLLIEYGANINITDKYGRTPLHYALGMDPKIIDILIGCKDLNPNLKDNDGLMALDYGIDLKKPEITNKIALAMYKFNLKKQSKQEVIPTVEEIEFNIDYITLKCFIKRGYIKLFQDSRFKKIMISYEEDEYTQHLNFVDKYINQYQELLNTLAVAKKSYEENKNFLEDLKQYRLYLEKVNEVIEKEKNISEELKKVKLEDQNSKQQQLISGLDKIKQFRETYVEDSFIQEESKKEKRVFIKEQKKIPKFQQAKIRNTDKWKLNETKLRKKEQKKQEIFFAKEIKQENLLAIEEWEKWVTKQNSFQKRDISKKTYALDLINNFSELQESFISLDIEEIDDTKEWWLNTILDSNLVGEQLQNKIIDKINSNDKKERKLTEEEFYHFKKIREDKINKQEIKNENLFPIIILHRNDLQDHAKGRPAISLGKSDITNQELVIPGTTRKLENYDYYHLKLNDTNTYFYLKNIVSIHPYDKKGEWEVNPPIKQENEKLLEMIDKYYDKLNQNINKSAEILKQDLERQKKEQGVYSKSTIVK